MARTKFTVGLLLSGLLLLALPATARTGIEPIHHPGGLTFESTGDYERAVLSVSGPDDVRFTESFAAGENPALGLADAWGNALPDGQYSWELVTEPRISPELRREMADARAAADEGWMADLATRLPQGDRQSGSFRVLNGEVLSPDRPEAATRGTGKAPVSDSSSGIVGVSAADQVFTDDVIVDGSLCVGFDCVNGENFGFDTIRLKENNVRIHFDDTSNTASFPSNDFRIRINDTTNGGAEYFGIEDSTAGRLPFRIEAGARENALVVENSGEIGIGTLNPVVNIHVVTGNTPTLRLEQDGSSGFTAQTWDLAGNEANFFIRDATNGSSLPFRIKPGAQGDSLYIHTNGKIGVGTTNPQLNFRGIHIKGEGAGNTASLGLGNVPGGSVNCAANIEHSAGSVFFTARPCSGAENIQMFVGSTQRLAATTTGVDITGNLTITGICSAGGGACDFVFDPDYELESIEDHAASMWKNSHLPAVGPTPDTGEEIRIDVFQKTAGMLEELEKAHIYIEQLHARLAEVERALAAQESDQQ